MPVRNYTYLVAVLYVSRSKMTQMGCFGTLVNPRFVLTLANRVKDVDKLHKLKVYPTATHMAEFVNMNLHNGLTVSRIHIHPEQSKYQEELYADENPLVQRYNVALLELRDALGMRPVELSFKPVTANSTAEIIGFEMSNQTTQTEIQMMKLQVPIVAWERCKNLTEDTHDLGQDQLCAGKLDSTTEGSCSFDDGIPLLIENQQAGMLLGYPNDNRTYETACQNRFDQPMIFASVEHHRQWIEDILGGSTGPGGVKHGPIPYIILTVIVLVVIGVLLYTWFFKKKAPSPRPAVE